MVKRNHKFQSGEGAQYMTRKAAMRKLQLSMQDFRRLCILKGIYPREPKHRAIAQRGSTDIKILYHKKDITFLLHEPIVWTLRDRKIFNRRIATAKAKGNNLLKNVRMANYPEIKLDHIIKERFPTFIDAIKELDDCMTLLFLFSTFPAMKTVTRDITSMARRLTIEFMHYCIAAKALRKVFVSIKGYYFQAEIKGELVTWIVPHYYPYQPQRKEYVDFKIMKSFADFFTVMAGFVNFRLYNSINLVYPPQFHVSLDSEESRANEDTFISERIAALNADLLRSDRMGTEEEEDEQIDLDLLDGEKDSEQVRKLREEAVSLNKLKNLFKGLKFFINREVPREPLVFILRCFGGRVSWDRNLFVGASFDESDETITHQIVDRPSLPKQYISRDYVQPQWIFDCVNQRKLLPVNKYLIGAVLPPHLSPFNRDDAIYVPPEEAALRDGVELDAGARNAEEGISDDEDEDAEQRQQVQLDYALVKAFREEKTEALNSGEPQEEEEPEEEATPEDGKEDELAKQKNEKKKKMAVVSGKIYKENPREQKQLTKQEEALRARMVKSRHKKLYRKMLEKQKKQTKEANLLKEKRQQIDKKKRVEQTQKRKAERKEILAK